MSKPALKINFLVHKGENIPLPVRFIRWILSSGRFIVIIVEVIVIGAFVYRYKLDADLITLQEDITQQSAYVESLKNDENLIRQTQFQLSSIRTIKQNRVDYPVILNKIAQNTPKSARLTNISIDKSTDLSKINLTISGRTPSTADLSAFIKALQKEEEFEDISLSNISFESQTVFTITGFIKQKGTNGSS
jgi:Tfp pilus assembly protein PilN